MSPHRRHYSADGGFAPQPPLGGRLDVFCWSGGLTQRWEGPRLLMTALCAGFISNTPPMKFTSVLFATVLLAMVLPLHAAAPDLQAIPLKDIDGKETSLKEYAGKVLLIVNVASKCGFTPQ